MKRSNLFEERVDPSSGCRQLKSNLDGFQNFPVTIEWCDVLCAVILDITLPRHGHHSLHNTNTVDDNCCLMLVIFSYT